MAELILYLPLRAREGRGILVFQVGVMVVVEREAPREVRGQPAFGVKPRYSAGARLFPGAGLPVL